MLKLAKSRILPQLTAILNQCLRNGEVPAEMADSRTILLFKKGDHLDLKNYRPISLLPTIYKVLSRVISARIDRTLDEAQPIEQAGFRKNCSTAEHLQAVNQLLEKAREYRVPIFMVFIDFEKAFDSVESNAIWNAAQRQGVHPKLLKLLRKHLLAGNVEDPSRKSPSPDRNPARRATRRHHQPEALQRSTGRNLQGAEMGRPRPEHQRKKDLQSALRRRHRPDRGHGRRTPADGDRVARSIAKERPQDQPTEDQGDGGRRNQHPSRRRGNPTGDKFRLSRSSDPGSKRSVQGNRSPDQQRMERLQEVWPVPDLQKRPDAMEAAALQPMHPAGAPVRMRILGLDASSKKEARSRPTTNGEKDGRSQTHRPSQQRLAPRRHEDQGRHRHSSKKEMVLRLEDGQRQRRQVAQAH
ncbi:hypothetical protein L596_003414 [Steinernema carpocapsae]|uniref:Reverse transcriptase domain-containing protein n=1 Tax=Steinernema carpocapsae TaxID=34508 RepID=A0A4V6I808_STECR|nr:hypothetical protein L596_003414 [Steinernema carpocapsae]